MPLGHKSGGPQVTLGGIYPLQRRVTQKWLSLVENSRHKRSAPRGLSLTFLERKVTPGGVPQPTSSAVGLPDDHQLVLGCARHCLALSRLPWTCLWGSLFYPRWADVGLVSVDTKQGQWRFRVIFRIISAPHTISEGTVRHLLVCSM